MWLVRLGPLSVYSWLTLLGFSSSLARSLYSFLVDSIRVFIGAWVWVDDGIGVCIIIGALFWLYLG